MVDLTAMTILKKIVDLVKLSLFPLIGVFISFFAGYVVAKIMTHGKSKPDDDKNSANQGKQL